MEDVGDCKLLMAEAQAKAEVEVEVAGPGEAYPC